LLLYTAKTVLGSYELSENAPNEYPSTAAYFVYLSFRWTVPIKSKATGSKKKDGREF
jgi:hypothetical protein